MMDGLVVDDNENTVAAKGETGVSWLASHSHAQHRRTKSASDRNLDASKGGVLNSLKPNQCRELRPLPSTQTNLARSSFHDHPTYAKRNVSSKQRASLEKDVEELQLHLQQEKSMRIMLERAMGRASSTLSPGHRHFAAQTKELITEIELLEQEVANREQHVLSLYRNIFEQCVSCPASEQNSSVASPAHTKHASRKHPSIISSAFCSSKKFPLRPLQLVSTKDLGKRTSKTSYASQSNSKSDIHSGISCSHPVKVREKLLSMEKSSVVRTLKDHLNQCPSKLSEEMVRCMAAVYCWLRGATSMNDEKNRSPSLSRSCTNIVIPQRGIGETRDWSCKSNVEVSWIATDKSQFSCASYAINNYRVLVEQLKRVIVSQMENNAQTAFWINVYNSLVMHAYLSYGIPHNSLRRLALFNKAVYNIGGHIVSANDIEQSIFCLQTPRVGWWLETILSTALRKKSREERQLIASKYGLPYSQPLVCFAICTGAFSDPLLRVYTASNIEEELEVAKTGFLQANVVVKKLKRVLLPKVLERFARETSISSDELLKWIAENVDKKLNDTLHKCIDNKSNKKPSQIIEWLPYISRFRYVFSKDLTEKPWWL